MPTICKVFVIHEKTNIYIVSLENLPAMFNQIPSAKEIIVTGPFYHDFILSVQNHSVKYCNNPVIRKYMENNLLKPNDNTGKLDLYKAIVTRNRTETLYVYSISKEKALEDIQRWTMSADIQIQAAF